MDHEYYRRYGQEDMKMNKNKESIDDYLQNIDFDSLETELEGLEEKQALDLVKEKMHKVESADSQMSFSMMRRDEEEEILENLIRDVDDLVRKAMGSEYASLGFIRPISTSGIGFMKKITVAEYFLEGIKEYSSNGTDAEELLETVRDSNNIRDLAIITYTDAQQNYFIGFKDLVKYIYGICLYSEVQTHTFISKVMNILTSELNDAWAKYSVERITWALEQIESKCTG